MTTNMKNQNETLWLPQGYGIGTIVYDLDNNPYEATNKITGDIYQIEPVSKEYAHKRIEQGASKLVSTTDKNPYAASLGSKGGSTKTDAKIKASRENGKKGGRPKKDSLK